MGGIYFCVYNSTNPPINIEFTKAFMKTKSRGLDDTQVVSESTPVINQMNSFQITSILSKREISEYKPFTFSYGFHRMSVNDLSIDASQPFDDPIMHKIQVYPELRNRPKRKLMCTGEIYNYNKLIETHNFSDRDLQSQSDVEIVMPLYIKYSEQLNDSRLGLEECLKQLNGDFSFILTENTTSFNVKKINSFAVRDCFGTRPLYMVKYIPSKIESNKSDIFYLFVSEIKSIPTYLLNNSEYIIKEVPPGSYWSYQNSVIDKSPDDFIRYYDFNIYKNLDTCTIKTADPETINKIYTNIKTLLTNSIIDRYSLSEQPVGVLLSGGFDSCIILSILVKYLLTQRYDFDKIPFHVFTIGSENSEDVISAKNHISYLEQEFSIDIHYHVINVNDIDTITSEITSIIEYLETFDDLTIQKSIPMLFLLKYIKNNTDVKILLSGEGLDELCGYNRFFDLDDKAFQDKSVQLLKHLSKFDLLRSDKIAGSLGLELRYPFLDKSFVEYILSIHPRLKRPQNSGYSNVPIEKYIIRKAFDLNNDNYMEKELLWRPRQSIHKSLNNLQTDLNKYYDNMYSDIDLFNYVQQLLPRQINLIPKSKEQMHYMILFNQIYPNSFNLVKCFWDSLW